MPDVFRTAEILISHALETHPGEIAIVAYYGSYARNTASASSDLDLYYIPDPGKALNLSCQFILEGLPYDFWPVSWTFLEEIASAKSRRPWAVAAPLLAYAKPLYHRSQEDLDRFIALKAQLQELTRPEKRGTMIGRALDAFKNLLLNLEHMRLAAAGDDHPGLRWFALRFVNSAANCLGLVNQTYFSKGWGANWPQVLDLPLKPAGFSDRVEAILLSAQPRHALEQAESLARELRETLYQAQTSEVEPLAAQEALKDFYYFVFEYKNKILSACRRGDQMAALYAAFHFQEVLVGVMNQVEKGFYGGDFNRLDELVTGYRSAGFPDLIPAASRGDLEELAQLVQVLDQKMQEYLQDRAIDLNIIPDEEALRRFLQTRDPV